RLLPEPLGVERGDHLFAFRWRQLRRVRHRPPRTLPPRPGMTLPVHGRPGFPECVTCELGVADRLQLGERRVDYFLGFSSESALSESISKSACAFPTLSSAAFVCASSLASLSLRSEERRDGKHL